MGLSASTSGTLVLAPLATLAASSMGKLVQAVRLVAPPVVRLVAPLVVRLITPLVAHLVAPLVAHLVAPLVARLIAPLVARLIAPLVARLVAPLVVRLATPILVTALVAVQGLGAESDPGPQTRLPQPAEVQALAIMGLHSF